MAILLFIQILHHIRWLNNLQPGISHIKQYDGLIENTTVEL